MSNPLLRLPAPRVLLKQVSDSAPWLRNPPGPWLGERWRELDPKPKRPLAALVDHPLGWWSILQAAKGWQRISSGNGGELIDYFALSLACHHASVATFVPTDVDSKIRKKLWQMASTPKQIERLARIAQAHCTWDNRPCSARIIDTPLGLLSGHDGERLSVMVGALPSIEKVGNKQLAEKFSSWINHELQREADIWRHAQAAIANDSSLNNRHTLAQAAFYLSHNAGDVDQGLGYWPKNEAYELARIRWGGLAKRSSAHGVKGDYQHCFHEAATLYRKGLAAEAHRHYPLREMKTLRRHQDFLFPCPPLVRNWGKRLALHSEITDAERVDLILGLLQAIERVPGQRAYQQALKGLVDALPEPDVILRHLPPNQYALLQNSPIAEEMQRSEDSLLCVLGL